MLAGFDMPSAIVVEWYYNYTSLANIMDYRRLGRTELLPSEVALGTVELGLNYGIAPDGAGLSPPSIAEATRLLHQAIEAGLNFIDTARAYGTSEEVAATVAFLVSEGAGYITGQNIRIDGGLMRSIMRSQSDQ